MKRKFIIPVFFAALLPVFCIMYLQHAHELKDVASQSTLLIPAKNNHSPVPKGHAALYNSGDEIQSPVAMLHTSYACPTIFSTIVLIPINDQQTTSFTALKDLPGHGPPVYCF